MNQDIHEIWDQITGDEKKSKKLCYIESPKDVGRQFEEETSPVRIELCPQLPYMSGGLQQKKRDEWNWFPHASEEGPLGGDGEGSSKSECRELQNDKAQTKNQIPPLS